MAISSSVTDEGNSVLIGIVGKFDLYSHRDFRDCYLNEKPDAAYILDLSKTDSLDSSALGIILLLREFAGGENSNISIRGCNESIKKIFRFTSFDKLFSCS